MITPSLDSITSHLQRTKLMFRVLDAKARPVTYRLLRQLDETEVTRGTFDHCVATLLRAPSPADVDAAFSRAARSTAGNR